MILVGVLAFANGANDNCKGVATLVGYGATSPRRALVWAAVTTAAGAAVSFWLAGGLLRSFSGASLFSDGAAIGGSLFVAVLIGAIGWVFIATHTGLPVSTTHAITGGLTGAGLVAFSSAQIHWSVLGVSFALPLALGPPLALLAVYLLAWPVLWFLWRLGDACVCAARGEPLYAAASGVSARVSSGVAVVVGREQECAEAGQSVLARASSALSAAHWTTSGMVGFARGWNDAPKIAALAIVAAPDRMALAFAVVTLAMAAGGLLAGRKVLITLSRKVTELPLGESLAASTASAVLVGLASWNGLPVSTTHVTTGGIVGAGLKHNPRAVRWGKVAEIVLSWVVTIPVAALLAGLTFILMSRLT